MISIYKPKTSIYDIVNGIDLYRKSIEIPGLKCKIVDYDYEGSACKFVIEFESGICKEYGVELHSSFQTLIKKIKTGQQLKKKKNGL